MRSNKGIWLIQECGVRRKTGTPDRGGLVFYSNTGRIPIIYPIIFKYLLPVNYTTGTPGDAVASGSSLVLPRAAADTRGQFSTPDYTGAGIQYSTLCYARAAEGGAGEEKRRRDEGTGEGAKEVARTAGGKAAGACTCMEERM
jgi:hypothetical protein